MSNDAWANDPDMRVIRSDDPDSRALLRGLGYVFWPYPGLLVVGAIFTLLASRPWNPIVAGFLLWAAAHVMFNPKGVAKVLVAITHLFDVVRHVFAAATCALAHLGAPVIAKLNRWAKPKPAAGVQAFAAPAAEAVEPPPAPVPPEPSKPKRPRFDWSKPLRFLFNSWLWVGVVIFAIAASVGSWFSDFGKSGREVAAEAEKNLAEANERTARAETDQQAQTTERVEVRYVEVARIVRVTEQAREAIAEAPNLDAGIAVHRDFTRRMRDEADAARAAAVRNYDSTVDP